MQESEVDRVLICIAKWAVWKRFVVELQKINRNILYLSISLSARPFNKGSPGEVECTDSAHSDIQTQSIVSCKLFLVEG